MMRFERGLMWFRRDLRLADNVALSQALRQCEKVYCVFVFDTAILSSLPRDDRRVAFIDECVSGLQHDLRVAGGDLIVCHGDVEKEIPGLVQRLQINAVFANRDYEPRARTRDEAVTEILQGAGCSLLLHKDQAIFERDEILNGQGRPYQVFTAYKNSWLKALQTADFEVARTEDFFSRFASMPDTTFRRPSLVQMGFTAPARPVPVSAGHAGAQTLLADFLKRLPSYHEKRDFPALKGPSYLSVHLRFGTISIRTLIRAVYPDVVQGSTGAATWLSELIWRDFYFAILHHFPHVAERAFRPEYEAIEWETGVVADRNFQAWCAGLTGYPIVDAGMRQLNQTGYMHNRLRMIVASFLTKDLGIDWRRGEQYFAEKLNDFDLAANNGGWQWAASTGCDAQPYFRIFNPVAQSRKFDAEGRFIRRYVPELAGLSGSDIHAPWLARDTVLKTANVQLGSDYSLPIVDHATARTLTLTRYGVVKR